MAEAPNSSSRRLPDLSPAAQISNRMVQLLHLYTGRGPTKARTTLNSNLVAVTFHDTLTRGEQSLVAAGQTDTVRMMRRNFHDAMEIEAVAAVEEILGRTVVACLSDVKPEANVAGLMFLLELAPESGTVQVEEVEGDLAEDQ